MLIYRLVTFALKRDDDSYLDEKPGSALAGLITPISAASSQTKFTHNEIISVLKIKRL